ncbi:hypothetical protein MmiHf6_16580 [Methanimicrococcus hongohii]|uniref:Uncharacterized protein n=2 Tax=Methanimicrococcus hongohii TaxID=3028295 RepID=A0AA96V0V6_9EURY|nr:hypothetical protein MmiHf6_16580 [Methanimicrococcus sp. Hf6]
MADLRSASHKISSGSGRAVFVKNRFAIFQALPVCSWSVVFVCSWSEVFVCSWSEVFVCSWREVFVCSWSEVFVCSWSEVFVCSWREVFVCSWRAVFVCSWRAVFIEKSLRDFSPHPCCRVRARAAQLLKKFEKRHSDLKNLSNKGVAK